MTHVCIIVTPYPHKLKYSDFDRGRLNLTSASLEILGWNYYHWERTMTSSYSKHLKAKALLDITDPTCFPRCWEASEVVL